VREDGRDRALVRVQPLAGPAQVAVLVDTSSFIAAAAGPYRSAIDAFVKALARITRLPSTNRERANRVVAFTSDAAELADGVGRLTARASDVSRLLDAIDLACSDLRMAEARRPSSSASQPAPPTPARPPAAPSSSG